MLVEFEERNAKFCVNRSCKFNDNQPITQLPMLPVSFPKVCGGWWLGHADPFSIETFPFRRLSIKGNLMG